MRIIDARSGEPVPAAPARRAPTRVMAHVPDGDPTGLRVLLVADLLVRALELGGTPVWAVLPPGARPRPDATRLGVRPFEDGADGAPDGTRTLHVAAEGAAPPDGPVVAVAPVRAADPDPSAAADPDALRAALLRRHHHTPLELGADALDTARGALLDRRRAVADWARHPSRPVPDTVRERLRAAWNDDLDAPGVLAVLTETAADPGLPEGARFEIHAHADRFLGLGLTAAVGTPP
nr:hypothetical protein [Streptomyces sp. SID8352]